jgi:hypothetical protein
MWKQIQDSLWLKWRKENPELTRWELWQKNKSEWVEAYRPFVKDRISPRWLIKS